MLAAAVPDAGQWNRHFVLLPAPGLDVAFQSRCMHFAELDYRFYTEGPLLGFHSVKGA